jgi:hypothetical protein
MLKKLIILNIVFILLFSSVVYASPFTTNYYGTDPTSDDAMSVLDPKNNIPDFLLKDYMTDTVKNDLELVTFLRPDDFSETFEASKDTFFFSCKALTENLIIKLFVFDEKQDIFVPVEKEITEGETDERVIVDTSWRFGLSGYLFCSFKMPDEGIYDYRLLIYDTDLTNEELLIGENLQILDFTVSYKEAVSFEVVLEDSFWDIYFNSYTYSLPLLP